MITGPFPRGASGEFAGWQTLVDGGGRDYLQAGGATAEVALVEQLGSSGRPRGCFAKTERNASLISIRAGIA
jgi:hypothetical protein